MFGLILHLTFCLRCQKATHLYKLVKVLYLLFIADDVYSMLSKMY